VSGGGLIGLPGIQARQIGAQQVGNDLGIALVGAGPTLTIPVPGTTGDVGRDDIELFIAPCPQEINQQIVGCFQADHTLCGTHVQILPELIQLGKAFWIVGHGQTGDDRALLIDSNNIMFIFTPINTEI
jgi:hypothetical protein